MPIIFPAVNPGPPPPAAFPDEVYNPLLSPVRFTRPGIQGYIKEWWWSSTGIINSAIFPGEVYDPTKEPPPIASPVGIQGYVRDWWTDRASMPNPAVFPDEVYNPSPGPSWFNLNRPFNVFFRRLQSAAQYLDTVDNIAIVFDPTTQVPPQNRPGIQGYVYLKLLSSASLINPATYPGEVFDPTTQPPPMARPGIQGYVFYKPISAVSLINPATFPDETFNPTLQPPWSAGPGIQGYVYLKPKSAVSLINPAVFPDQTFDPTGQLPPQIRQPFFLVAKPQRSRADYLDFVDNAVAIFDPTTVPPPQDSPNGIQGYVRQWWRSFGMAPAQVLFDVFNPTLQAPPQAPSPFMTIARRLASTAVYLDVADTQAFDPTGQPPPLARPAFRYPQPFSGRSFSLQPSQVPIFDATTQPPGLTTPYRFPIPVRIVREHWQPFLAIATFPLVVAVVGTIDGLGAYIPDLGGQGIYVPDLSGFGSYVRDESGSGLYLPDSFGQGSYNPDVPGGGRE